MSAVVPPSAASRTRFRSPGEVSTCPPPGHSPWPRASPPGSPDRPLTAACRQAREVICSWRALGVGRLLAARTGQRPLRSVATPSQSSAARTHLVGEVSAPSPLTGTASLASRHLHGGQRPRSAREDRHLARQIAPASRSSRTAAGRTGGRTVLARENREARAVTCGSWSRGAGGSPSGRAGGSGSNRFDAAVTTGGGHG